MKATLPFLYLDSVKIHKASQTPFIESGGFDRMGSIDYINTFTVVLADMCRYAYYNLERTDNIMANNYLIARIENYKMDAIGGVGKEQEREKNYIDKYYNNPDFDKDRMNENVTLVHDKERDGKTWERYIRDYHAEHLQGRLTTRGNDKSQTNVGTQFMVTASPEYLAGMDRTEQIRFFKDAFRSIEEQYPDYHWAEVTIHFDEKNPHLHALALPVYHDRERDRYILSTTKTQAGRDHYRQFQDHLHRDMTERYGYNVSRGVKGSDREHLSVKEYKELQEREKALQHEREQFEKEKEQYKTPPLTKTLLGARYSKEDVERVVDERNRAYTELDRLHKELQDKDRDINYLCQQIDCKDKDIDFYNRAWHDKEILIERVREIKELEEPARDRERERDLEPMR